MRAPERYVLLVFVCAVALLLRAGYVAVTYVKDPLRTDAGQYAQAAHNLVEHGTFSVDRQAPPRPDSLRSPGYPALLAVAMAIAGSDGWYAAVRWLQVALSTLAVWLAFALLRPIAGDAIALGTAALTALSPHLVTSCSYILTETACSVSLLGALLAVARHRTVLAGVLLLATAAINESFALLPLALLPVFTNRRQAITILLIVGAGVGAWAMRSHGIDDPALRGSQRALMTMTHGAYPDWVHRDPRYRYSAYLEDEAQPEFGRSWQRFAEVLSERVGQQPGKYLAWYLLGKPAALWGWSILQGQGDVYVFPVADSLYETQLAAEATRRGMQILHPLLVVLAAAGAAAALWRRLRGHGLGRDWLLLAPLLYATAVYTVFAPWPRYATPLRPELYGFALLSAAAGARAILARWRRPIQREGLVNTARR